MSKLDIDITQATRLQSIENFTGNYSTITVAADSDCNSNDLQPVTLTTTQLTCLENKGQVEFKFEIQPLPFKPI